MDNHEEKSAQVLGPDGHVVTTTYTERDPGDISTPAADITTSNGSSTVITGRPSEAQLTEMRAKELAAAPPAEKPTRTILDHLVTGARNLVSRMQPPERRITEPAPSSTKTGNTSPNPA
jgi:hypothetical protein